MKQLSRCIVALVCCIACNAIAAINTFQLTATEQHFDRYFPTYLANGYFSVSSSLSGTVPTLSQIVGVMDYTKDDVSRPAAIPSWNEIDYYDGRAWLNAAGVRADTHRQYNQTLDMYDGVLRTQYQWHDGDRITDLRIVNFVSQSNAHLAVVSFELTPHFSGNVQLRFTLRAAPAPNRLPLAKMSAEEFTAVARRNQQTNLITGGDRDLIWYPGHVNATGVGADETSHTLWMSGRAEQGHALAVAAALEFPRDFKVLDQHIEKSTDIVSLDVQGIVHKNQRYRITKYVAVSSEAWGNGYREDLATVQAARVRGLQATLNAHTQAWHQLWATDIKIGGDEKLQRTIHSDLFYLLENTAANTSWAVGACGFSPNYYGHVFWDSDVWVFPSLLLLYPDRAASLVNFRQRTLPPALARAKAHGLQGAMYPWESDPWSGEDVTPTFAVANADSEIHVNGAVALAQWQYYLANGDLNWLRQRAYPVIKAIADFWASRATYNTAKQRYEILHVTSVEENYTDVNNEIYTNFVAHKSLATAIHAAQLLNEQPNAKWHEVAEQLYLPTRTENGVYYDFDPSTPHDQQSWMATPVPMLSIPAVNFTADSATLQGLFKHSVAAVGNVRDKANQMILVMLAIQAATVGESSYFNDFVGGRGSESDPFLKPPFNVRSETPQNNSIYLLASSGGFVQAFVYGATGLRVDEQGLDEVYAPVLPKELSYVKVQNLAFRGKKYDVTVMRDANGKAVRKLRERAR